MLRWMVSWIAISIAVLAPPLSAYAKKSLSGVALQEYLQQQVMTHSPAARVHAETSWAQQWLLEQSRNQTPTPRAQIAQIFNRPSVWSAKPSEIDRAVSRTAELAMHQVFFLPDTSNFSADIPMYQHRLVNRYIKLFTGRGRRYFRKWLARADKFQPIMQPILQKKGLPSDLIYLAMIESGLESKATSVAKAGGYWQFMPATARFLGMRQDYWIDDRRDFIAATEKAAQYLDELHGRFDGDWYLAWAAYNGGWGRVGRAVKRHGRADFWYLVRRDALPEETAHYVPRILAAAIVSKLRDAFGFDDVEPLEPLEFDAVAVRDAVDMRVVAREIGVPMLAMRQLNPSLRRDITPPRHRMNLRVPRGYGPRVQKWLASLPANERIAHKLYKVRSGDSLYKIAKRHGTTMQAIKQINAIRNPRRLRPGTRLIIPSQSASRRRAQTRLAKASKRRTTKRSKSNKLLQKTSPKTPLASRPTKSSPPKATPATPKIVKHTVSPGETLWAIARRYDSSVDRIRTLNGLGKRKIRAGERIGVPMGQPLANKAIATAPERVPVQAGDTLWAIAQRHDVRVDQLRRWNRIRNPNALVVGMLLHVKQP